MTPAHVSRYAPGDPAPTGYIERHEWADVQDRAGLEQTQCAGCLRWWYPQELEGHVCAKETR
jgi:hypothetical protein